MNKKKIALLVFLTLLLCVELSCCAVMKSKETKGTETSMTDPADAGDMETPTAEHTETKAVTQDPVETEPAWETEAGSGEAEQSEKTPVDEEPSGVQTPETEPADNGSTAPTMNSENLGEWT